MKHLGRVGLALTLAIPLAAQADAAADTQALRREIEAMRADYESRLRAMEQRLQAAEAARAAPAPAAAPTAPSPPAAAQAPVPAAPAGRATAAFNPAISLILSGLYTRTSRDPASYTIGGFSLPPDAEIGPGGRGLSLAESELGFSASIDPWFSGEAHVALHPDDSVSVEEAFVQTTALGRGLTVKAGRFLSGVGYLNSQHAHSWDFVDSPLAYQAMLGSQFGDDGLQLTWLAPSDRFLRLRAEVGRGRSYPGGDSTGNGVGMAALAAHTGGDVGESHSWQAGLSLLRTRAADQALAAVDAAGTDVVNAFTGNTRVWIADFVWKWAPQGNASRTNFKLQGEYLHSRREGSLTYDTAGVASADGFRASQSGWYLQGVYQFMPRWRVGLRTERLDSGNPSYGANAAALASGAYQPRKHSLMFDYSPSEFSRVRLQLARDHSRPGAPDNQLFLQYQMSLGAHGGHRY